LANLVPSLQSLGKSLATRHDVINISIAFLPSEDWFIADKPDLDEGIAWTTRSSTLDLDLDSRLVGQLQRGDNKGERSILKAALNGLVNMAITPNSTADSTG